MGPGGCCANVVHCGPTDLRVRTFRSGAHHTLWIGSQLRHGLELGNGIEFLKSRGKAVRQTPHPTRLEVFVLRRKGDRLGPYQIVAPLGAGGRGEVYGARDPRLNRDVAVKTFPAAFANDLDRIARFEREAQVLAALNHPNITMIFSIEDLGRDGSTS